jgi:hypothetical protein
VARGQLVLLSHQALGKLILYLFVDIINSFNSSWTSPYAAQFTGAASAQKAGALLAGAGAVAAMLL